MLTGVEWIGGGRCGPTGIMRSGRHRVFIDAFTIAAAGYQRPELWLSEGSDWDVKPAHGWTAPLYWQFSGIHLARDPAAQQ